MMKGDLHCHTRLSNGSVGIEEIVMLAARNGVDVLAITDRDCMAGNVRGKMIGEKNGIKVVPGVQISCTDKQTGNSADMLCYMPDFPDRLEGLCHSNQVIRKKAGQLMMLKASAKFNISADFILKRSNGSTNLYRHHIMHALMDAGYTDKIFGQLYDRLFSPGSPDFIGVNPVFPSPQEVLTAIHDAGGVAVLTYNAVRRNPLLLESLVESGLDGVEIFHPLCTEEQASELAKYAQKHKLLITGGSDFHGMYARGCTTVGSVCLEGKQLDDFLNYKSRKKRQQKRQESKAVMAVAE